MWCVWEQPSYYKAWTEMGSRLLCIFDFMFELDVLVENNPIPAVLLQPTDRFLWILFFLYSFYPQPSQAFQSTTTAKLLEPLCSQLGNMPFWHCAAFLSKASLWQPNIFIFGIISRGPHRPGSNSTYYKPHYALSRYDGFFSCHECRVCQKICLTMNIMRRAHFQSTMFVCAK